MMAQRAVNNNFLIILSILMVSGCKGSNKTVNNRKNDEKITQNGQIVDLCRAFVEALKQPRLLFGDGHVGVV